MHLALSYKKSPQLIAGFFVATEIITQIIYFSAGVSF